MADQKHEGPPRTHIVLDEEKYAKEDYTWWLKDDKEIGPAAVKAGEKYEIQGQDRRDATRRFVQLFKGKLISGSMYDSGRASTAVEDISPAWNLIQSNFNTAASMITRSRVRIAVITTGAEWDLQEDAKQAELAISGIFRGNKVYEELDPVWFFDGGIPGLGILQCEPDPTTGEPVIERVIPDEFIYSETEAINGRLRQVFRVQWMSKWEAAEKFGDTQENLDAISTCQSTYSMPLAGSNGMELQLIPVWTAWFIPRVFCEAPTKKDEEDKTEGKRVVAIPGHTLNVRPYRWTRPPHAFFRVERAPVGVWGIGIAERLAGFQFDMNEINADIREARKDSLGKWMVEAGSNVNDDDFTDEHGRIVRYSKTKPNWERNDGIPESLLREREELRIQASRELGMSEWSVAGTQPKNGNSGEYLNQLRDQEQGRAVPCGQNWEAAHVDLAEIAINAAVDGFAINKDLSFTAEDNDNGDGLTEIRFEKIAKLLTSKNKRTIQAYPTSILPASPQGKFEKVKEWEQKGWIDSSTAAALSEQPDLNQESSLQLAGIRAVRKAITAIIRTGKAQTVDPAMPLELGFRIAQATFLKGLSNGMPEKQMQLLAAFRDECLSLQKMQGPAPVAQTPGNAAPGAPVGAVNAPPMVEGAVAPQQQVAPPGSPQAAMGMPVGAETGPV
jgi:hypothetical protein